VKKVIGTRIRKLRESKDYTQENMAVELDITAGAYAKIERGETDPSITRLIQIAQILQVDVTFFLQETSPVMNLVEEPENKYGGYASKNDVENLIQVIKQLQKDIAELKLEKAQEKKNIENKNG
jgi:transcriptional regulator with XRE-family HTH domain